MEPSVSVKKVDFETTGLSLLVSPNARQESLRINQKVWIYKGKLGLSQKLNYKIRLPENGVMIYLINGILEINATLIHEGSTVFLKGENFIELVSKNDDSSFVLIDTVM